MWDISGGCSLVPCRPDLRHLHEHPLTRSLLLRLSDGDSQARVIGTLSIQLLNVQTSSSEALSAVSTRSSS